MTIEFPTGTYHFHDDPNFNYQMNRWTVFGNLPVDEMRRTGKKIKSLDDYCEEFLKLAKDAEAGGNVQQAAFYYRAVDFFLPYGHPEKEKIYDRAVFLIREHYSSYFENKRIVERRVPYRGGNLPVWHAPAKRTGCKGTVLLTGGFDCLKEELVPVLIFFSDAGYDIYYFEGPGQGETLMKEKMPMTHEWEKPVAAVLDHFRLDSVTMIGISLGGYLAPRAAAFERRIKKLITWGIMHDFFDVVVSRRGLFLEYFIKTMLFLKLSPVLNAVVRLKMKRDAYTHWGVDHGMHVLGASTPAEYFHKLSGYSMKGLGDKIRQDVLLTTGSEDHFVPVSHFYKMMSELKNTKSLTGRIFTARESGENHCQFGNIGLTLEVMTNWIAFQEGHSLFLRQEKTYGDAG